MGFSIGSALRFGWETFKKRPWLFVASSLLIGVAQILVNVFDRFSPLFVGENLWLVVSVLAFVITTLIAMGVTAFYLAAHDKPETVGLSCLWHPHPFWKYLGLSLLFYLIAVIGVIGVLLLSAALGPVIGRELGAVAAILIYILLGAIFLLMFMFATFLVVDRGLGPIKAMKESYRMTHGHMWDLFGFYVTLFVINALGFIALIIGLLVSVPVSLLALTHAYRVLSGNSETPPADSAVAA